MAGLRDDLDTGMGRMANKVESLFECAVCLETLNDPRTLPCFHSFCKVCLEKIVLNAREKTKVEEFPCPTCNGVFVLKTNQQVAELSCSHFIRNMLEAVQLQRGAKHAKCSKCSEEHACSRCLTCELFLCEACLAEHNSVRESWPCFKKHPCSVLSIEELTKPENQSKIKSTSMVHCNKHEGKKLKFYCETCKELICRYCMDFIHIRPDHECLPVELVAKKRRESLVSSVSTLKRKLDHGKEALEAITGVKKKLNSNMQTVKESIKNEKEEMKALLLQHLEENANKKCAAVDQINSVTQKVITRQENKIQSFVNEVDASYSLVKNILVNGSNVEIIESEGMVCNRMGNAGGEETNATKVLDGDIKYYINPIDDQQLHKFLELGSVEFKFMDQTYPFEVAYYSKLAAASKILKGKDEYIYQMVVWLAEENFHWRLCYRGSLDGWKGRTFHSKCDNKGPTVVLVQVGNFIFGGFTDVNWSFTVKERKSNKSFMFSLSNNDDLPPFKSFLRKDKEAIFQDISDGAIFGLGNHMKGRDLSISDNAGINDTSFSDFGHSYTLPDGYVAGSTKARSLLAGSFNFTPSEVEVFY